jgi:hypothetical protein
VMGEEEGFRAVHYLPVEVTFCYTVCERRFSK